MVDVTICEDRCPKCGGNVDSTDAWDGPGGRANATLRCGQCAYQFDVEQLWVLKQ